MLSYQNCNLKSTVKILSFIKLQNLLLNTTIINILPNSRNVNSLQIKFWYPTIIKLKMACLQGLKGKNINKMRKYL
ncbi:hypothetical protein UT300003_20690 [Clostridium sardiniense]